MTDLHTCAASGSISSSCWALTPPPIRISCGLKMCTSPARPCAISLIQSFSTASVRALPAAAASKIARPSGASRPGLLGAADQRRRGGVALIAADGTAGAGHAVQRVQAEMSQLTAKAPRTLQQTAAGEDAAADAGASA